MKQLRNKFIFLIITFFFITKLFFFNKTVWWDSAVYIGMGKYIYSFVKAGLWEASRQLVWSLVLGLVWKLNLDVIFYSKLIELLFSLGCIYLTYLIGKNIFNEKIALLSAFFVALSPTFFNYITISLTDIPSLFFGLLSVYSFIKKKYFLTGIFSSLAFMTRFLQLGVFLILFLILLLKHRKNYFRNVSYLILGFVLVFFPYIIFNYFKYNDFIYPFFLQIFMTKYTGWMYHESIWFYFYGLFKENFLFIFSIFGLFLMIKKRKYKENPVFLIFSLFFVFFILIKHKEMRFIITFLPYLSLITAYGMFYFLNKIKNKRITKTVIFIILLLFIIQSLPQFRTKEITDYSFFHDYIDKEYSEQNVWITNPAYVVNSNKVAELMYYPTFNLEKINELRGDIDAANLILINTCDIPCHPLDKPCFNEKPIFIDELKKRFETVNYKKNFDCEKIILKK